MGKKKVTQQLEMAAPVQPRPVISSRRLDAACVLLFAAASALVFKGSFIPNMTIDGADASLWVPQFVQQWTEHFVVPRWFPHFLAGIGQQFQFLSHGLALMLFAPPHKYHGFEFMLDAFLAGAFMFLFLRDRGIGRFGSVIGALSFQLGNGLITGARQGALWKFETACWVPLFLLFFSRVLTEGKGRTRNSFFAGMTLGLVFLGGEVQLAYYVCLLALAYFLFDAARRFWISPRALDEEATALGKRTCFAILVVAVALTFAAEVFVSYLSFIRSNENVGARNAADNWRFATEFSFPPEDALSLLFTGKIFSEGARPNAAGARIERITDDYLGILALMFAALAPFSARRDRWLFLAAACGALLIAFGRYFPLPFRLVYSLPLMSGLRNPHKWLFITGLCTAILAGMGADYWLNAPPEKSRKIIKVLLAFLLISAAAALVTPLAARAAGRGAASPAAFVRPLALLVLGTSIAVAFKIGKHKERFSAGVAAAALAALLAGDLIFNASGYLLYYNYRERLGRQEAVSFLRSQPQPFRVKLWAENAHLRYVMTEALPFYGIDVVDAIMSRRPPKYSEIFQALREQRLSIYKFFQLFNVRYIVSAAEIETEAVRLNLTRRFSKEESGRTGADYLYEFADYLPRAYLVDKVESVEATEVIGRMADPAIDLRETVIVENEAHLKEQAHVGDGELQWTIDHYVHSPHRVSFQVDSNKPAVLVYLEYFDDNWQALIDGRPAELLRANYLMRGVALPQGRHLVEFIYSPTMWGFWLTAGGWSFLLLLMVLMGIRGFCRASCFKRG